MHKIENKLYGHPWDRDRAREWEYVSLRASQFPPQRKRIMCWMIELIGNSFSFIVN